MIAMPLSVTREIGPTFLEGVGGPICWRLSIADRPGRPINSGAKLQENIFFNAYNGAQTARRAHVLWKSSPPRGLGGSQNFRSALALDRRDSHAQIFFLAPQFLAFSNEIKTIKRPIPKALPGRTPAKLPIYFPMAGGGQKSATFQSGTGWLATRIFSRICENFFFGPAAPRVLEILSRNSGWGGGRRTPMVVTQ
jgi:hypothetical protein